MSSCKYALRTACLLTASVRAKCKRRSISSNVMSCCKHALHNACLQPASMSAKCRKAAAATMRCHACPEFVQTMYCSLVLTNMDALQRSSHLLHKVVKRLCCIQPFVQRIIPEPGHLSFVQLARGLLNVLHHLHLLACNRSDAGSYRNARRNSTHR